MIQINIARSLLSRRDYREVESAVEALAKLEVHGAISRAFLDRIIAEIAEEVADQAVARRVARA